MQKQSNIGKSESYQIDIGGRTFHITSSNGEGHIRQVENKVSETIAEITKILQMPFSQQTALLAALNIADELVGISEGEKMKFEEAGQRITTLIGDLDKVL